MLHFKDVSRVKVMNPFCIKYMYCKYKAICEYVYNMVKKNVHIQDERYIDAHEKKNKNIT